MRNCDHSNSVDRKVRTYRLRAIRAALYAKETTNPACARAWTYIAQSLNELADITERAASNPASSNWPKSRSALGLDLGSDIS